MLEALLAAVDRFDLTPDEVAEAVWLARFVPGEAGIAARTPSPEGGTASSRATTDTSEPPAGPSTGDEDPPLASLRAPGRGTDRSSEVGTPVRLPGRPALPDSARLTRALRPLRRLVEPAGPVQVDEQLTAVEIAQTGLWLPCVVRAMERRFEVALVVDTSAAVGVWRDTVLALRSLLERLGAFRNVRLLALEAVDDRLLIREAPDPAVGAVARAARRDPAELIDPAGRRIILLLSDCVSDRWRELGLADVLRLWGRSGPVAIVQTLPYRLWSRCAASFTAVRLSRSGPGYANVDLLVQSRTGRPAAASVGVAVPVFDLRPHWLATWARLLADPPHTAVDAMILDTSRPGRPAGPAAHPSTVATADELVGRFRASAPIEVYRLACYLAAVPLSLPVMRLVQSAMAPRTSPSDLAEVFLSGLWSRTGHPGDPPGAVEYEFRPGVRELLLGGLRRIETRQVLKAVSRLITATAGPEYDLHALLSREPPDVGALDENPTFASISAIVLRSLGYADLADRLTSTTGSDRLYSKGVAMPSTDRPSVFEGVPPRNVHFTGRERLLQELRDRLVGGATALVPCALHGLGGVGKTQIAVEYCYRYQSDYELVWWVSAEQPTRMRASIAELAPHLGLTEQEDLSLTVNAVLDALRRGAPYRRWLLVFDNAAGPEEVREFFRYSDGHLLITSRDRSWAGADSATALEIDVFSREDSITLLRRRLEVVTTPDAGRLADRVGDLPMALEQAAAYQLVYGISTEDYLRLLDDDPSGILAEGTAPGYDTSVQATFRVAYERLRQQSLAAAQLLEFAAFFGAEPISRSILLAARNVGLPSPLSTVIRDDLQLIQTIGVVARLSLARLDARRGTIQLHRLLRELVQHSVSPEQQDAYRRWARATLGHFNPGEPDNTRNWPAFAEIAAHVNAVGCVDGEDEQVRRVLLDQVRYLYVAGDYLGSWELGEPALKNWRDRLGVEADEPLILARHLGNSLRALGRNRESRQLNEETWQRLRSIHGPQNVHALVTANSYGADLRVSGEFQRAYDLDRENVQVMKAVLGDDLNTIRAANNLAVDLRLLGRFIEAKAQDQATLATCREILGTDHPQTYLTTTNLAFDLFGVGDYAGAISEFEALLPMFEHKVGAEHSNVLRATRHYAAVLRCAGRSEEARTHLTRILRVYRTRYGESHVDTIAATATLANALLALGETRAALGRAEAAVAAYSAVLGSNHPFTLAVSVNLAVILRAAAGETATADVTDETHDRLRDALGHGHPFTLAAKAGQAADRLLAGSTEAAVHLSEAVHRGYVDLFGERHPTTLEAAANLALYLASHGDTERAEALIRASLDDLSRALGPGHPTVQALRAGRRTELNIEPAPT